MKKILIAPNSFKESASSVEAAYFFQKYLPSDQYQLIVKPISDGGDGFLSVCKKNYDLQIITFTVPSAYSEQISIEVPVGYSPQFKTIFIESADVLGLKKIPLAHRNPMSLNSVGLGELLNKIKFRFKHVDLNKIIIGIGGTGTIDMGIGVLSSFGLKLIDSSGEVLSPIPKNFLLASEIIYPSDLYPYKIEFIIDVNNPLLGENGGIKVYGSQKGASESELAEIENGIINILSIFEKDGLNSYNSFLSGAGGGVPAGLSVFLKTYLKSANEFIFDDLNIRELHDIDYLITGEGKFDSQSIHNKGAGILLNQFQNIEKIFLCCGIIDKNINFTPKVYPIQFIDFFKNIEESSNNIELCIKFACNKIHQIIS